MLDGQSRRSRLEAVGPLETARARDLLLQQLVSVAITHLEGSRPGRPLQEFLALLARADMPTTGHSAGRGEKRLLGVGPGIWLATFVLPSATHGAFDVVLDMTAAWTRLGVSGANAPKLLAKGCAVDLHPRCFPVGACAATGFAGIRTILWQPDDEEGFELWVGRSYAVSLWHWLMDAAAEFGIVPARPDAAD